MTSRLGTRPTLTGTITQNGVNMYQSPSANSDNLIPFNSPLNRGYVVTVLDQSEPGWVFAQNTFANTIGYIESRDIDVVEVTNLLIPDLYWKDVKGGPRWDKLSYDSRYAGGTIKATQGTSYPEPALEWFKENWSFLRGVGGDNNGKQWFRGCYHFLDLLPPSGTSNQSYGTLQAEFYLETLESAGGLAAGDLPPIVDLEIAGAKGQKVSNEQVEEITTAWANTVQFELGRRPMLYRRSKDTDFPGLTSHMGCSFLWAKRYAQELGKLTNGWNHAVLWQYTDGKYVNDTYPNEAPGIGHTDTSLVLIGDGKNEPYSGLRELVAASHAVLPLAVDLVAAASSRRARQGDKTT